MKLVFHQLCHEVRRSSFALGMYLLILFCNYAVAAGWIGAPELSEPGRWNQNGTIPVLFAIAYWTGFAVVVTSCVLPDSLARPDRFLTTRPLHKSSLLAAKALFILLAAVLPATLVEAASVASLDAPGPLVLRASLEHFLLCGVVATPMAAFAAHWKSSGGMILAAAIATVCFFITGALVNPVASALGIPPDFNDVSVTMLGIVQGVLVLAGGLGLTAAVCSRRGRKLRFLVPAFIPLTALAAAVVIFTPFRSLSPRAIDQERVDRLLESGETSVRVLPAQLTVNTQSSEKNVLNVGYTLHPLVSGAPEDLEFRWAVAGHETRVNGAILQQTKQDPNTITTTYAARDSVLISPALSHSVQSHLGSTVTFRLDQGYGSSLMHPTIDYSPRGPMVGANAQVQTEIIGDAYRWNVAADLALDDLPVRKVSSNSTWRLADIEQSDYEVSVLLAETAVQTSSLIGEPFHSHARWREQYRFLLYLPDGQTILFGDSTYVQAYTSVSAVDRFFGRVDFRHQGAIRLGALDLTGARLLILQAELVGRLTTEWSSPAFTLPSKPYRYEKRPDHYDEHERLSGAEFALWFDRWEKRSPDEEPSQIRLHLKELFSQVARVRRPFDDTRDPTVRYAARFVPKHLAWLLDEYPRVHFETSLFLLQALTHGALETQKQQILEAFLENPGLSAVVDARGWGRDSREVYRTLVDKQRSGSAGFLHELLPFQDPEVDSLILDTYRVEPTSQLYETLRDVPRLSKDVERITREAWSPGNLVIYQDRPDGALTLALHQGRPEALAELFRATEAAKSISEEGRWSNPYYLANLVSSTVFLPKELRRQKHEYAKILNWLLQHDPADFTFDPVLRRFVLNAAPKNA